MKAGAVTKPTNGFHRQDGAALISALLMLLVVTVMGIALNSLSTSDVAVAVNTQDSQESWAVAESGFAHARVLADWPGLVFDDYLNSGDGTPCSGDELVLKKFDKKVTKNPPKDKDLPKDSDRIEAD